MNQKPPPNANSSGQRLRRFAQATALPFVRQVLHSNNAFYLARVF